MGIRINATNTKPVTPSGSEPVVLDDFPNVSQVLGLWCWAACAEMIVKYKRRTLGTLRAETKCKIAKDFLFKTRRILQAVDCCPENNVCDKSLTADDITQLYLDLGLNPTRHNRVLTNQELHEEIVVNRRPVQIVTQEAGRQHTMVIYGYNDTDPNKIMVSMIDPSGSDGDYFLSDILLVWTISWINF